MKTNKTCLIVSALMLLAGCTGKPVKTVDYYLLNPASSSQQHVLTDRELWVSISLLSTANYLRQQNLVIQLTPNQLYFSPTDLWAAPVSQSFVTALQNALHDKQPRIGFVASDFASVYQTKKELAIQLEHFVITEQGSVILSGQYVLSTASSSSTPVIRPFNITDELTADGYEHAVGKLRGLVAELAEQIVRDL